MESPRKNNDCYFYYYSTCTKGDSCTFRHEPSALGCETTCSFWKEGKCINVRCNFRHMELRKNRKVIPCYWESQPGGCLKPHCPFLHQNPKHPSNSENQGEPSDIKTQDLNKAAIQNTDSCAKNASQGNEKNFGNPVVDPLVVNFEEESDNESAPTHSPAKTSRSVNVKTLEEIRLEKIQAESAAYYSYPEINSIESADDLRRRIIKRLNMREPEEEADTKSDFHVLTLDEIRNRKKRFLETKYSNDEENQTKRQKISLPNAKNDVKRQSIDLKVKTLEEIRAERAKKFGDQSVTSSNEINVKQNEDTYQSSGDSEVSSTSKCEVAHINTEDKQQAVAKIQPVKRLKRKSSISVLHDKDAKISKVEVDNEENDREEVLPVGTFDDSVESKNLVSDDEVTKDSNVSKNETDGKVTDGGISIDLNSSPEDGVFTNRNINENNPEKLSIDSSKLDDVLLLDVEEFESNDVLKAEEDILKDIDKFLND